MTSVFCSSALHLFKKFLIIFEYISHSPCCLPVYLVLENHHGLLDITINSFDTYYGNCPPCPCLWWLSADIWPLVFQILPFPLLQGSQFHNSIPTFLAYGEQSPISFLNVPVSSSLLCSWTLSEGSVFWDFPENMVSWWSVRFQTTSLPTSLNPLISFSNFAKEVWVFLPQWMWVVFFKPSRSKPSKLYQDWLQMALLGCAPWQWILPYPAE